MVEGKEVNLDAKEFNSPQPCSHGIHCTYKNEGGAVCAFVHPGEEGTGRMLFPARVREEEGKSIWQPAAVRLIGSPGFYQRRRLGLSWPEWCLKKGIHVPKKGSASAPPPAPKVVPPPTAQMPAPAHMPAQMPPHMMAYLYQMAHAQKQAQAQAEAYARQMEEAKAILARNHMGNILFGKVATYLDGLKALNAGDADFVWPENITPGKITGMFLEGMALSDIQQVIADPPCFEEKVGEALDILNNVWEARAVHA
jgi:hypothetical protein